MPTLLYVGQLGAGETSQDRADELAALGASVDTIPAVRFGGLLGKLDWIASSRLQISPSISSLNRAIVAKVAKTNYDILWLDKGWMIQPGTLKRIRDRVSSIVLFNNDNPWGDHERGMWRLLKQIIPLVDEIVVPRYSVVRAYELRGAKQVSVTDFGFAPARQYCPDAPVTKEYDLCFIGTAIKDGGGIRQHRTEFLVDLAKLLPGRISVFGYGWKAALRGAEGYFRTIGDGVYGDLYRETIWKSKVSLSFVTRDYWDETSHRAFEITACGGCLLAERTSRLERCFAEAEQAVYFNSVPECARLAAQLLEDESLRNRISLAGHERAIRSGYDNRSRLREVIGRSPLLREHFPNLSGVMDGDQIRNSKRAV